MNAPKTMLPGERYRRLVSVERVGTDGQGRAVWKFQCDCGGEVSARAATVRYGATKSCGCLGRNRKGQQNAGRTNGKFKHGLSRLPEYRIWIDMRRRCHQPHNRKYPIYGGRGIEVCERWRDSFENFFADMGPRPTAEHSIDRIDGDKNYEPGNCRWATIVQQNQNRRYTQKG